MHALTKKRFKFTLICKILKHVCDYMIIENRWAKCFFRLVQLKNETNFLGLRSERFQAWNDWIIN